MNKLRRIIDECVRRTLYEGGYWGKTATPLVTNGTTGGFKGHSPGLDNGPEKNPSQITGPHLKTLTAALEVLLI